MNKIRLITLGSACGFLAAFMNPARGDVVPAVAHAVRHAVASPSIAASTGTSGVASVIAPRDVNGPDSGYAVDAVTQDSANVASRLTLGMNFDGMGQNAFNVFTDTANPPNSNLSVGATQVVQVVSSSYSVYSKATGDMLLGPADIQTLFTALGGICAAGAESSPLVVYDKLAGRWIISEVMSSSGFADNAQCIAISAGSDATSGPYTLYEFDFLAGMNQDVRLGVWPDAYYLAANSYLSGTTFIGALACALDRSEMLAGSPTPQIICFQEPSQIANLLPADLDGATAPPIASPDYFMNLGVNAVNIWKFHVNFAAPSRSTFTGPVSVTVAAFQQACSGACIPQSQTTQRLVSRTARLMPRLAYRRFPSHESLVVNHSVQAVNSTAVRWYEIRSPGSTPTVFQQGTYSPDSKYRWNGSVSMDSAGDIALAYSVSSANMHPSIRFAVRTPADTPGSLESENSIISGTGSQTGSSTWGGFSSMNIDPADDCTFWYTNEYLRANGNLDWNTRIASFRLNNCPATNPSIQITSAPPYGSPGSLQGTVSNVSTSDYVVAPLLFVPGLGWYAKPTCAPPSVPINSDGTWSANVDTGGVDYTAAKYVAYLVPTTVALTCWTGIDGLPPDLEAKASARAFLLRPNPNVTKLIFSGFTWDVSNSVAPVNPGPCTFSDSTNNAFVDSQGDLHLNATNASGPWTCTQVISEQAFGYGTYTFNLASPVDTFDPNVVVGLFTWSDDPMYPGLSPWVAEVGGPVPSHSELDVEFSKFGNPSNPNNAQFTVQPYTLPQDFLAFVFPPGQATSRQVIQWLPTGITFQSFDSTGNLVATFTFTGPVPPPADSGTWPGPVPAPQNVRMNVWLFGGAPTNGQPAGVVISGFSFIPAS